jgi:hypothetical protein
MTDNPYTGAECALSGRLQPEVSSGFDPSPQAPEFNSGERTGSSFDDFLQEEGLLTECSAIAIKRVLARQLAEEMKRQNLTKTEMAKQMQTSRAQLDRLLDPEKTGVSLETITRAATVVGRQLRIELV